MFRGAAKPLKQRHGLLMHSWEEDGISYAVLLYCYTRSGGDFMKIGVNCEPLFVSRYPLSVVGEPKTGYGIRNTAVSLSHPNRRVNHGRWAKLWH